MSSRSDWQISFDQGTPIRASVISIGSETAKILQQYKRGYVLAVFDRSFYVQCGQHLFCIGVASLGRGPLHLLIVSERDVLPFKLVSGLSINLDVHCGPTEENHRWLYSGKVSGKPLVSDSVRVVKEALKCIVPPPQQTGFGWIAASIDWQYQKSGSLMSGTGTGVGDASLIGHALPTLKSLHLWLECALQTREKDFQYSMPRLQALLGAGPGLTPSGDDLLAGIMLALHRVQRADLAECLWKVLEPHLQHRTNVISGAHLRMAAIAQCSEPVLTLLTCIFTDNVSNDTVLNEGFCYNAPDVQSTATNIQLQANTIGASSGWDMLAGMTLVLRAL